MSTEDPWSTLDPPATATRANMKPISEDSPWAFYWMLDFERRRLLGLRHAKGLVDKSHLPHLSGVTIETVDFADSEFLIFKLLESAHREIFQRLCLDIISATASAPDERQAVGAAIARTWRWHYLLKGGTDGRLSPEEQKGLIGELRVLEDHVLEEMSAVDAIEAWTGPSGAPKDFELGSTAIEAKARRGGAQPKVRISSADQLDAADFDRLFLHVIHLSRPGPGDSGVSLNDIVDRIRKRVQESDIGALLFLEEHLVSAGYRDEDDYADSLWIETGSELFEVIEGFPRIITSALPSSISRVSYDIALVDCLPFATTDESLSESIRRLADDR